ncbi:Uncharacterised protein [Klebsiella pneumoniae]|nr:Uncharacterised protein [Klebsiella pneumoniae]SVW22894.1 Uncharacterised protein [Klebsiella pneumoniae]SYG64526.1 Uncharacterised protein [Klebsiella pneumoniae]
MINVTFFSHVLRQQLSAKGEFCHVKKRAGIVLVFITTESFHGLTLCRVASSIGFNKLATNGLSGYPGIIAVMNISRRLSWLQSPGSAIIAELVAFAP